MNREEFNRAYRSLNPETFDPAHSLIHLAANRDHLTGIPYNFVPVGDGLYEILKPDGRDGFFPMKRRDYNGIFVGTLEEAYQRVFEERRSMYER